MVDILNTGVGRYAPFEIAWAGDSRLNNGQLNTNNGTDGNVSYMALNGPQMWVQRILGGRISCPRDLAFGVAGDTIAGLLARIGAVCASRARIVVVWIGTNSATSGQLAQNKADLLSIMSALYAAGKYVVLVAEAPRGNSTYPTYLLSGTTARQWSEFHRWLIEVGSRLPNVVVANIWPQMVIYNSIVSEIQVQYAPDGLHPNELCNATIIGPVIAAALDKILPPGPGYAFGEDNGDIYDAANNPRGNILTNGMMTGTGGTLTTNFTGVLADSWTSTTNAAFNAGTAMSVVGSKVAFTNGEWQQFVLSGTTASNSGPQFLIQQTLASGFFAAGDKFRAYAIAEIDAGYTGLGTVDLDLSINGTGNACEGKFGHQTTGTVFPTGQNFTGNNPYLMITPEVTVSAAVFLGASLRIHINPQPSSTLSATVRVRAVRVAKILNS